MSKSNLAADPQRLLQLVAEAKYARERHDLYRARTYGPRQTSAAQLRRLEQAAAHADSSLERARANG